MDYLREFISYLFILLIMVMVMKIVGVLHIGLFFIISLFLISIGLGTFLFTLNTDNGLFVVFGTTLFLIGILLFIVYELSLISIGEILVPALFFICGLNALMLFFDSPKRKFLLILGSLLLFFPLGYLAYIGRLDYSLIADQFVSLLQGLWFILAVTIVSIIMIVFLQGFSKQKSDDE